VGTVVDFALKVFDCLPRRKRGGDRFTCGGAERRVAWKASVGVRRTLAA